MRTFFVITIFLYGLRIMFCGKKIIVELCRKKLCKIELLYEKPCSSIHALLFKTCYTEKNDFRNTNDTMSLSRFN